ncbi:MAG: hypothetical protein J3R72DRAFT_442992 [Linnemannia gamsii]|nr:MAG: hypothetical protein J3R72DRAFT_442992 [Linnemannia gamsii]
MWLSYTIALLLVPSAAHLSITAAQTVLLPYISSSDVAQFDPIDLSQIQAKGPSAYLQHSVLNMLQLTTQLRVSTEHW